MIALSLKETEFKRDFTKNGKLNWSYLEKGTNERVKEKDSRQVKAFKNNHFGKNKMVHIVLDSSKHMSSQSDEGLTVVNEHTYEETKSSGCYKTHLNDTKK